MLCVVAELYTHKSCYESSEEEFDPKTAWASLEKCYKPIQDEALYTMFAFRFDDMKPFAANGITPKSRKEMEALFFNDRLLVENQNRNSKDPKLPKMTVTSKNADSLRHEWCTGPFRELGMPTERTFDRCNRLFGKSTYALIFEIKVKRIEAAQPVSKKGLDPHEECLEARDYEGCIKVKTSGASRQANDQCSRSGLCTVTTRGVDSYGFLKPMGWKYRQLDDVRIMYFEGPKRIPHNGDESRYIGYERITRYYQNPGGVRSAYFINVFDCKEMTYTSYKNSEVWIGWKSVKKKKPTGFSARFRTCKKGDQYILKKYGCTQFGDVS